MLCESEIFRQLSVHRRNNLGWQIYHPLGHEQTYILCLEDVLELMHLSLIAMFRRLRDRIILYTLEER